jgi:cytochrome b561
LNMSKISYSWSPITCLLHGLLALAVVVQVGLILFRESLDRHGSWASYRGVAITLHKDLGVAIFFIVLAFLIWKLISGGKLSVFQFYPVTKKAREKVIEDLHCLFYEKKLPIRHAKNSLGTLAMLSWNQLLGVPVSWGSQLIYVHKFFAGLIWWYLGGHVGMVFLHKLIPLKFQKEILNKATV